MGSVLDDLPGGSFTALLNDGEATANALGAGADLGAAAAAARLLSQPQPSQQVPWQPGEGEEDEVGDGGDCRVLATQANTGSNKRKREANFTLDEMTAIIQLRCAPSMEARIANKLVRRAGCAASPSRAQCTAPDAPPRPPASAHSAAGRRRRTGRRGEARAVRALTCHDVAVLKTRGLLAPYLLTWPAMGPQVTEQSLGRNCLFAKPRPATSRAGGAHLASLSGRQRFNAAPRRFARGGAAAAAADLLARAAGGLNRQPACAVVGESSAARAACTVTCCARRGCWGRSSGRRRCH